MMKYFLSLILLMVFKQVFAQDTTVFALKDLYEQMRRNHPIVKLANLYPQIAEDEIRIARGNFDPKFEVDYVQKTLQDNFYYSYWDSRLKAPVWIGELKGGFENNEGARISTENKSPKGGLMYAGISVPLGQGLIIDARRAVLRQAQMMQQMAEAERIKELNKLFFSATKDYWEWFFAYRQLIFVREGYRLADERYKFIKQRILFGDAANIDSVEARITLQERTVQLRQAEIDFKNAGLVLSNNLWQDGGVPLELSDNAVPENLAAIESIGEARLNELLVFAQENHPEIQKIRFKIAQLDIERRFQRDRLKPMLNLNYNLLSAYAPMDFEPTNQFFANNYKIGFDFSFPILLRKERGKLNQTRFKLDQTRFDQSQTAREIGTQIRATYNELMLLEQNIALQEAMVNNQRILTEAEYQRFRNGESSVFLINARETKLIEMQVKLVALQTKYEKAKVMLRWAAGERFWE